MINGEGKNNGMCKGKTMAERYAMRTRAYEIAEVESWRHEFTDVRVCICVYGDLCDMHM